MVDLLKVLEEGLSWTWGAWRSWSGLKVTLCPAQILSRVSGILEMQPPDETDSALGFQQ